MGVTSKHLNRSTDLVVVMPIKSGLVPALETKTYASRLRIVLKTFDKLRVISREAALARPLSDAVDRIRVIHAFRFAMIDHDAKLLLAVTFDGPFESYMRVIWRDLGALMNPILCNCDAYPGANSTNFNAFQKWVRDHQIGSDFIYNVNDDTVKDILFQRELAERQLADRSATRVDLEAASLIVPDAQKVAATVARNNQALTLRTGFGAISALYRLAGLYTQDPERQWFLAAAHDLLVEFNQIYPTAKSTLDPKILARFRDPLAWYEMASASTNGAQEARANVPKSARREIQGGILNGYKRITHGAFVLIRITDASAARDFLATLPITFAHDDHDNAQLYINVALTLSGLKQLGLSDVEISHLPKEFREGMAARAGMLGDVRSNHPSNWPLPARNWPPEVDHIPQRVQLSSVDIVLQLRSSTPVPNHPDAWLDDPAHPTCAALERFSTTPGVQFLSVEAMSQLRDPSGEVRDHFGFVDGKSQPVVGAQENRRYWDDQVNAGEVLLGYPNDRGDGPRAELHEFLANGTFLVVRKLRQDVDHLEAVIDEHRKEMRDVGLTRDGLKAKLMGRTLDGDPLARTTNHQIVGNDFNYVEDLDGQGCPLQAHVRRANPRDPTDRFGKTSPPRIIRRGMSYGRRDENADRGLMFIAYNASIAEQFEVIQSWMSGGNSSGLSSRQSDPFLGVPQLGRKRTFRTLINGRVFRCDLDGGDARPLVQLEWGLYAFVPSRKALSRLSRKPATLASESTGELAIRGEELIETLGKAIPDTSAGETASDMWRGFLEDTTGTDHASEIWAAVRENHNGVLRTPFGVLVGSNKAMEAVLSNDTAYSTCGYLARMRESFGEIYLGLDAGETYDRLATATNAAIQQVSEKDAFDLALKSTRRFFGHMQPGEGETNTVTMMELSDWVLGELSYHWFDLPDEVYIELGPLGPSAKLPRCPGAFTPPSRYIFSPNPGDLAATMAKTEGQALFQAVENFVREKRGKRGAPRGALTQALFDAIPSDDSLLARTIIGAMMGFLPTVDGNFRVCMYTWTSDQSLWRIQEDFLAHMATDPYARARAILLKPLMMAMQKRPVPMSIWRTATRATHLGGVPIKSGDKLVLGITSVTQEKLGVHQQDVYAVFGGRRRSDDVSHPTHACPGYAMAMGVLLGMIAGLVSSGTLLEADSPLSVKIRS